MNRAIRRKVRKEIRSINDAANAVGSAVNYTFGSGKRRRITFVRAEVMSAKETYALAREHKQERKRLAKIERERIAETHY